MARNPWDDDLDILSAENVNFAIETAGLGSRFGAAVIDLLIQALLISLSGYVATIFMGYLPPLDEVAQWIRGGLIALGILLLAILTLGYSFLFEWLWDGQTPGKRALRLRVLHTNGMPLTPWAAAIRSLLRTVDFLPFFYGVGAFCALFNANNRRVGDLVAGTIVAREGHDASRAILDIDAAADAFLTSLRVPLETSGANSSTANSGTPATVTPAATYVSTSVHGAGTRSDAQTSSPTASLPESDRELLREFFIRRTQLKEDPRRRLAHSLASRLALKLGYPAPNAVDSEAWLEALARAVYASAESEAGVTAA
jgi:uncharacterized RDD family membrane protein YckC